MTLDSATTEAKKRAKRDNCITYVAYNRDSSMLDWFERYIATQTPDDYAHIEIKSEVYPNGKVISQ